MPVTEGRVCPQCGRPVTDAAAFCSDCGLDLAAQFALPTAIEWHSRNAGAPVTSAGPRSPAVGRSPQVGDEIATTPLPTTAMPSSTTAVGDTIQVAPLTPASIVASGLAGGAGALLFVASFLSWVDLDLEDGGYTATSYWELANAVDILLTICVTALLTTLGLLIAFHASATLRILAVVFTSMLVGAGLIDGIEVAALASKFDQGTGIGTVLAITAGTAALAALTLQGLTDGSRFAGHETSWSVDRVGFILLAVAGVLFPVWMLLPITRGESMWEDAIASDVVLATLSAILAASALASALRAISTKIVHLVVPLAAICLQYAIFTAIEGLALGASGAGSIIFVVLEAPLLVAGITLVGIGTSRLRAPATP